MTKVKPLEVCPARSFPNSDLGQLPDDGVVFIECGVVPPAWVGEINQIGSVHVDTGSLQNFGEVNERLSRSRVIHEDYAIERLRREGWPEDAYCESVKLGLARRSTLVVRFTTVGDELRVAVVPSVEGVEEIAMARLIHGCIEQKISH